ncbi:MAG TPA: hypothetical protein VK203_30945 [Nostocaceae cyanobacterium]|nr:hypothetical protein [Nostocaceae cyanobacterium]
MIALRKLDQPLPPDIQSQLNEVGKSLQADPNNIGNLDIIAEKYPPLDEYYQEALAEIESYTIYRNKGGEPDPLPTEPTKELTNAAINSFSSSNSVDTAKEVVKPTLLSKVVEVIIGRKTNG